MATNAGHGGWWKWALGICATILVLIVVAAITLRALVDADQVSDRAMDSLDSYGGNTALLVGTAEELRLALLVHPEHARSWAMAARLARTVSYRSGDEYDPAGLRLAHDYAQRALTRDPDCFEAHVAEAWTYRFEQDLDRAESAAREAERLAVDPGRVHLLWSELDLLARRPEAARTRALEAFSAATDDDGRADAIDRLKNVHMAYGDLQAADSCHQALVELRPTSAWTRGNYALFLLKLERHDEAIAWADSALAIMDYPMARTTRARARSTRAMTWIERQGRWQEAHAEFQKCLEDDPESPFVWFGIAYVERGRYEQSQNPSYLAASNKALTMARGLDPDNRQVAWLQAINDGNGRNLLR